MKIFKKDNKGKCPQCGKWVDLTWNKQRNIYELHCCKKFGLHKIG